MIWHAIWFLCGFLCGMTAVAFLLLYLFTRTEEDDERWHATG